VATNKECILEILNLKKKYGETRALQGLDLKSRTGIVHTVFGENGSGKSTMVKILSGIVPPNEGIIRFAGTPLEVFNPRDIQSMGIVAVMQEILVAPNRTVLDNIFLGYDRLFRRNISRKLRSERAREVLKKITNTEIDLEQITGSLPLSQQQLIVIARALIRNLQLLILDESTAALDIDDREHLFNAICDFVAGDRLVIFISHRVDEVLEISDCVTVLRNGKTVDTVPKEELSESKLLELVSK
jgi:ribose transport system ATP-binding protein